MYKKLIAKNLDLLLKSWLLLDENDLIVHWSTAAQQALGYEPQEILNQPFFHLLPDYRIDRETYLQRLFQETPGNSIILNRVKLRNQNGVILEVELSIYSIPEEGKNFKLIAFEKITEIAELQQYTNNKQLELLDRFHFFYDVHSHSDHLRDIYDAVLVSATSGHGLKFNRAYLLLIDQADNALKGIQAIGPASKEEAGNIYDQFGKAPKTLTEMIALYREQRQHSDLWINEMIRGLQVGLSNLDNIFIQTLYQQRYCILQQASTDTAENHQWFFRLFQTEAAVLVPLVWNGRSIGLLIVDNAITGNPFSYWDINSLINFTHAACEVLVSMRLLTVLEKSITAINEANLKLKESQQSLLHQEKMAAKGQLLNQMAHEVRGPLAVIGGYARRVSNKVEADFPLKKDLERIVETAKTLELVLNDILDKEIIKSSEISDHCDAAKVIHKVVHLFEEEILQKKVSVNLNLQGNLPPLPVPEHHLFEILNNLIRNALESMTENGLLLIIAQSSGNKEILTIQDTGIGIPVKVANKLFSPYFTTKAEGTGLGLIVVKKLVKCYNGAIEYHSIEGKGTTFTISFPLTQSTSPI